MELANFIVEAVLKNAVKDKVVVYGGRFQPFHNGHKKVYDALVSKFGSKNVYIATSDVQDGDKSPLSFAEKKEIATKLFNIPSSKFVKVKSPYQPVEILRGFDDTTTALIVAVGEKDDSRLGGAYFKPYKGDDKMKPYGVEAYVYTNLPSNSFGATDVRNMFRNKRVGDKRKEADFAKFFGKFDKDIYKKLDKKLNESTINEENPDYRPDSIDYDNILNHEFSDPSTGRKFTIRQGLHLDPTDFAHQEARRIFKVLAAKNHIQAPGNIGAGQQSPKTDKQNQLNLSLGVSYGEGVDLDEASASGSGYDEKTLDQLVDNPETGEKVKVRSALNYPKNHPAYQKAIQLVRKVNAKLPQKKVGGQKHPVAVKPPQKQQPPNASEPISIAKRFGAATQNGANTQNGTHSTNKTQKPLEKPLSGPNSTDRPVAPQSQEKPVSIDKVKKDIPNFSVDPNKSDISKISTKQRKEVSMKINELDKLAKEAKAKGEKAPTFNLCDITIPGTNLYCGGNKGIDREAMPQFKGKARPGSEADQLPKDKDGEVDGEALFKKMLEDKGIKVSKPTQVPADQLKATQTDLVGTKVAGMTKALEADPNNPGITAPIYVSSDGYVLDGHHRWAAVTSHEIASGRPANMNVRVIDMPINELVKVSNKFADDLGIERKVAGKTQSGIQPTKSTTDATNSGDGKVTNKAIQNSKIIARTIKHNIGKWSADEQKLFKTGQHKADSPLRTYIGKSINNKINKIVPSVKQEMEHLGHAYQFAGNGLATLVDGKPVDDKSKDAIKKLAQVLSVNSIKSIDNKNASSKTLMQHLGKHLASHMADVMINSGIGKVIQNAGTELDGDNDKYIEWFGLLFAQQMKDGKIPLDVWDSAIQDYNRDKEDGKITGKREDANEVVISEDNDSSAAFGLNYGDYAFGDFDVNIGGPVPGNLTVSDITANANSANSTVGTEHNATWQEYDNQPYYTGRLAGWQVIGHLSNSLPDEVRNRVLPIFNHGGNENGPAAHTLQKIVGPEKIKYEGINVDVKKGDEILTGKFKNKKTIVKDIGKDVHGMPTINGKQATTFRTTEDELEESLITEGGAYGHMAHPFDIEMNLTFGDLKNIINNALDGNLGVVREKTDGQALAISWKNGRLIAARNKGNLANAGANAMDAAALASKFNGRGALSDAYNFAMKDLESAIRGLSQAQKDKIFKNGKVFMNLEVIWPTSVNVIPYGQALLIFHNAIEYNEAGNPIGKVDGAETVLAGMIKQINADVQSKYVIKGPPITELPKTQQLSSKKAKYTTAVSKLQSEFGLKDTDGVADYHQAWWRNFIKKAGKKLNGVETEGLIKRWAFDDKSMRIGDIKDEKARTWAEGIDKNSKQDIAKGNLRKFEDIFLGVGAEVLSFMSSVLTANPDKAMQAIHKRLQSTADQIMNGGTITQIKKLEMELARLNALGGFEKIVPNEGLVFQYNGNTYKLTGAFAPLNQILGIFY